MNYLEFFEANKITFTGTIAGEYLEESVFESYAVAKDLEIERLTQLIRSAHSTAYNNGRVGSEIDGGYYEEQCWMAFKSSNNL
ncbi:MAG TPA: hypothetical protein VHL77_06790 [Ferruginibacter sp.]|jgi:hypothetical protein|nr:hypothetical protein [Ferruginibacter sp.]